MDLQPNSNRNDTVITHLLLIERTLPLFHPCHAFQDLSSKLELKMILLYIFQGQLEFIWTEGYSGRSSNPGLTLAIFQYFANSTTDANFRPFSGHFNYIATFTGTHGLPKIQISRFQRSVAGPKLVKRTMFMKQTMNTGKCGLHFLSKGPEA